MTAPLPPYPPAAPDIARFPLDIGLGGVVTARRALRLFAIYMLLLSFGFALTQMPVAGRWQIFGLGLMVPGGGFLAHADFMTASGILHVATAALGLAIFGFSIVLWFATGNAVLPPLVWLTLAFAAALTHGGAPRTDIPWVLTTLIAAGFCVLFTGLMIRRMMGIAARKKLNTLIAAAASPVKTPDNTAPEMDMDDLKRLAFLLDRALQPVDRFDGFEWRDQFQTAAIRYQINFAGYALSMAQARYMPALRGYMQNAQKNLIEKLADRRVWGYWQLENSWGNLDTNPDPTARDNIMYTGFAALQMSLYQRINGADDYNRRGSLPLRHPNGKEFDASLPALTDALQQGAATSDFHLIACEPNWIFPLCNAIGAAALKLAQPEVWTAQADHFRHALEREFIAANGRILPCRSAYTGLAAPAIGGALTQALPVFFLNALLPDIAARQWLTLRRDITHKDGRLRKASFWPIDTGNYAFSRAAAYAVCAMAAAEMGDEDIKSRCLQALDTECPLRRDRGYFYRPQASVWAHAAELMARAARQGSFRDLAAGMRTAAGPYIQDISYAQFMVAAAHADGNRLNAVIYPRHDKPQQGRLMIGGLSAGRAYSITHTRAEKRMADAAGIVSIDLSITARTAITLEEAT